MATIPLLAPVALTVDLPDKGLTRGQMGTGVEILDDGLPGIVLVEFADDNGQTYAISDLDADQVLVLHRRNRAA